MRSDADRLRDILNCIETIRTFIQEGRTRFHTDRMVQSAVMYELEVIGEAARNLSEDLKAQHPQVPWKLMSGTRNRLIHVYFRTDLHAVWNLVSTKLVAWQEEVSLILRDLES